MAYEYLFSALRPLPAEPGERPPIEPGDFAAMLLAEGGAAAEVGRLLLLQLDLKVLERKGFGLETVPGALFSAAELDDLQRLPPWLRGAIGEQPGASDGACFDRVWRCYYRMLLDVVLESKNGFLRGWLPWEVGLRNALAIHRASRLGLAAETRLVELEGAEQPSEFKAMMEEVTSIEENANMDWREVDRFIARKKLLCARELAPIYTFDLDELMSYTIQFIILSECKYLNA